MQLSIPLHAVNVHNVYFVDRKKNTVIEGDFTKLLYSTPDFVMSGLYVYCPWIQPPGHPPPGFQMSPFAERKRLKDDHIYSDIIMRLCEIEHDIVTNFCAMHAPHKQPIYCLQTFFTNIVNNRNNTSFAGSLRGGLPFTGPHTLKISGVWENKDNVGITVKFQT